MRTRKAFLDWISVLDKEQWRSIDQPRFFDIQERDYVFSVLKDFGDFQTVVGECVRDFTQLESQRYEILEKGGHKRLMDLTKIQDAISFCALTDTQKKKRSFQVNPEIKGFLAHSSFLWNDIDGQPERQPTNYLFIPSFLQLAPKEICLIHLNALLMDLKDYGDVFTYGEFLELVSGAMEAKASEMDALLLEFITNHVLYYQTFLPIDQKSPKP